MAPITTKVREVRKRLRECWEGFVCVRSWKSNLGHVSILKWRLYPTVSRCEVRIIENTVGKPMKFDCYEKLYKLNQLMAILGRDIKHGVIRHHSNDGFIAELYGRSNSSALANYSAIREIMCKIRLNRCSPVLKKLLFNTLLDIKMDSDVGSLPPLFCDMTPVSNQVQDDKADVACRMRYCYSFYFRAMLDIAENSPEIMQKYSMTLSLDADLRPWLKCGETNIDGVRVLQNMQEFLTDDPVRAKKYPVGEVAFRRYILRRKPPLLWTTWAKAQMEGREESELDPFVLSLEAILYSNGVS